MNNKTKNLIAFAFTAFVFVFASHASAAVTADDYGTPKYSNNYYNNNYGYSNNYNSQAYAQPYQQPYQQQYAQTYQQPAPVYNQPNTQQTYSSPLTNQSVNNSVNNTSVNTTKTTTVRHIVSRNTAPKPTYQNQVAGTNVGVVNASDVNQVQADNLPALSMRGSNTFMPDTVFEWLLTIIFILVIIIIIRLMSKKHGHGDHH
jgi:ATP-dependent Zn protease